MYILLVKQDHTGNSHTILIMSTLTKAILVVTFRKSECETDSDGAYPDMITGTVRLNGHENSATSVKFYRIPDDVDLVGPDDQIQSSRHNPDGSIRESDPSESTESIGFAATERDPELLYYYSITSGSSALVMGSESIPYGFSLFPRVTQMRTSRSICDYEICYAQPSTVLPAVLKSDIKSYVSHNVPDSMVEKLSQTSSRSIWFSFTYWTSLVPAELDAHMVKHKIELDDKIALEKNRKAYEAQLITLNRGI